MSNGHPLISQSQLDVSIQGDSGSYSDMARLAIFGDLSRIVSFDSFKPAFATASDRQADRAVIPYRNLLAGGTVPGVANLVRDFSSLQPGARLHVIGEHVQPIDLCFVCHPDAKLEDIRVVYTHPVALEQCYDFKGIKASTIEFKAFPDTGGSARMVQDLTGEERLKTGAICPPLAAQIYDVKVLERKIQDAQHNETHFLALSRKASIPPLPKGKKSHLNFSSMTVVEVANGNSGSILRILQAFERKNIPCEALHKYNATSMRPSGFWLDIGAHSAYRQLQDTLQGLKREGTITTHRPLGCFHARAKRYEMR